MWNPVQPASKPVPPHSGGELPLHARPISAEPVSQISIFGKSLVVKGEVSGSEPLQIEGRVEGSIALSGNHVSIGRDGTVAANVTAQEVVIRGTLLGNVTAGDRVEIHGGGSVVGDIATRRISIEDGAHFQGSIDMRRPDPKAHSQSATDKGALPDPLSSN